MRGFKYIKVDILCMIGPIYNIGLISNKAGIGKSISQNSINLTPIGLELVSAEFNKTRYNISIKKPNGIAQISLNAPVFIDVNSINENDIQKIKSELKLHTGPLFAVRIGQKTSIEDKVIEAFKDKIAENMLIELKNHSEIMPAIDKQNSEWIKKLYKK